MYKIELYYACLIISVVQKLSYNDKSYNIKTNKSKKTASLISQKCQLVHKTADSSLLSTVC